MISSEDIEDLCAYIHSTNVWKQKVSEWFKQCGQAEREQVELESELTSNIGLASEIIKCTLAQVNEDEWSVETWKEKLKRKGKSFDMTLIVTFNYLTRVLEGTQLNVVGAWELLKRHTIPWSWYNSRMNPEYSERTKFYFDLDAALSEHVDTPSDGPVDDMPGWASAPLIPAVRSQNSIKWETVRTTHTCPRNTAIEGVEYGEVHKKGFHNICERCFGMYCYQTSGE